MKSKIITHIILEGCDGVGKDTIMTKLWPMYNFKYRVYMRGELSDYVYAKIYNRNFISTQRGLPFLYVLITKNKEQIKNQIINRGIDVENELLKVNQQDLFIEAANEFKKDYHIITVNVDNLTPEESAKLIYEKTIIYINNLKEDEQINQFNQMYINGCSKHGLTWKVKNNQPFIDNDMIMADAQLHNGNYETYSNKKCPHNLLFSLGYSNTKKITFDEFNKKKYDFAYPINSKILVRNEIYNYIQTIIRKNTLLTTNSEYINKNKNIIRFNKVFGDNYISTISKAKATIYCSRDLAYLKMMTVRCYEAVLANQIIFVDKKTDPNCEILKQIYGNDKSIIKLLYVDETTLIDNYNLVMENPELIEYILNSQHLWYNDLLRNIKYENN